MKTLIRQPGNKTRYLRHIVPLLPACYNTYYEPFLGTGALFLHLQPNKWVINDINDDLMNMYTTIRDDVSKLIKNLQAFANITKFITLSNTDRLVLLKQYILAFNTLPFTTTRVLYYIILRMTSFTGCIIVRGEYKFPGLEVNLLKGAKPFFLSEKYFARIRDVSNLLNTNGEIYNLDYKEILKKTRKNDFCFIDSPYDEASDYQFSYNTNDTNKTDFVSELYTEVKKLDKKKVKWLMTQADTKRVRERFKEYIIISFPVYRGFKKTYSTELIIKNY